MLDAPRTPDMSGAPQVEQLAGVEPFEILTLAPIIASMLIAVSLDVMPHPFRNTKPFLPMRDTFFATGLHVCQAHSLLYEP
jgi:hypothetical protein